jgi:hypothetical protein
MEAPSASNNGGKARGGCMFGEWTYSNFAVLFISEVLLESTNAPELLEIKTKKCKLLFSSAAI